MDAELKALGQVAFSTVHKGRDIWRDDIIHVDGIHTWAFDRVLETLDRVRDGDSVGNLVIQGRPGIGKSHFLGRVRHAVIERGQVFVLFHPGSARRFWEGLAIAYMDAFHRDLAEGGTQLSTVFRGLGEAIGLQRDETDCLVAGTLDLTHLRAVRRKLQGLLGRQHRDQVALDVALALILANSEDFTQQDIGNALLQGQEVDLDASRAHFIRAAHIPCRDVVGAFDRLTGAAGACSPCGGRSARRTGGARTVAVGRRAAIAAGSDGDGTHGSRRGRAALAGGRVVLDRHLDADPRAVGGVRARPVSGGCLPSSNPFGKGRGGADRRVPPSGLHPRRVHASVRDLAGAVDRVCRRGPVHSAWPDQPGSGPLRARCGAGLRHRTHRAEAVAGRVRAGWRSSAT